MGKDDAVATAVGDAPNDTLNGEDGVGVTGVERGVVHAPKRTAPIRRARMPLTLPEARQADARWDLDARYAGELREIVERTRDGASGGPVALRAGLEVDGVDDECILLAVDARIDPADELVVVQDRHREIAVLPLRRRVVDLDAVAHAEQRLGARTVADQRVKGRQQGGAAAPAPL